MIENGSVDGTWKNSIPWKKSIPGKKKRHITAFYIETLILAAVFTMVILVLTRVFAWSGRLGQRAEILTSAVHLAENAAEAVAASDSLEDVKALLGKNGNGEFLEGEMGEDGGILRIWYDDAGHPASEGDLWVDVAWRPAGAEAVSDRGEGLVECTISVCWTGETEPVYTLETAVYVR